MKSYLEIIVFILPVITRYGDTQPFGEGGGGFMPVSHSLGRNTSMWSERKSSLKYRDGRTVTPKGNF